jgi:uncharacterized protein (TIGR02996 family)
MPSRRNKAVRQLDPYPPGWEPFLAAIIAMKEDDLPRLVFADWLDENGDPDRAELIRLQCRLVQTQPSDPGVQAAQAREKELLDANWDRWTRGYPPWVRRDRFNYPFTRGFIASVAVTGARFAADGPTLVRRTPLELVSLHRITEAALRSPALSRVGRLDLEPIDSARVSILAEHPDLLSLRRLTLDTGQDSRIRVTHHISRESVRRLLANPTLTGLREFELRKTKHGDTVARSLAAAPFRSLEGLTLYHSNLTANAFREFVQSSSAGSLRGLYLAGNPIGNEGVRHLVESPFVTNLDNLNLSDCGLSPASAERLAAWPGLRTVRWMALHDNDLGEREEALIRNSPHAESLVDFYIRLSQSA